jgi:hypothetical protein
MWNFASTPPYVFKVRYLIKHSDNLICTFLPLKQCCPTFFCTRAQFTDAYGGAGATTLLLLLLVFLLLLNTTISTTS